jgi:predicted MFS family arabinose efflux permease
MVMTFLTLYLTKVFEFRPFQAGVVVATYGLGSILGVWSGGRLVNLIGYRSVQIWSMILAGVGFIVFGMLGSGREMYVGIFVLGALAESFRPANAAALAAFATPEERPRAYALNRLALNLGWTAGPALGGFLLAYNYSLIFWVDGATCILAGVALAMLFPAWSSENEIVEPEPEGPVRSPWRDKFYLATLFLLGIQGVVFMQVMTTYPLYLRDVRGLSPRMIGWVLAFNGAIIVATEMPLISAIKHRNALRTIAVGVLFIGLGMGLLPLHGSLIWILFLMLLWTIGEMLVSPLLSTWVANRADKRSRPSYMAAMGMTFSACHVISALSATAVYDFIGPNPLWFGCLGALFLTFLGYRFLAARET